MREADFKIHGLDFFSPKEVTDTGASLEDVKLELMVRFQKFRSLIGRRIHFIFNGLTTGGHNSPLHPGGLAGDWYPNLKDGPVKVLMIFKAALEAGFTGIGIYWNGKIYSFHFDLRPKYAFWCGTKSDGKPWDYHALIVDPKVL